MTTKLKDEILPCLGSAIGGAMVLSMLIGYYIRPPNPPPERLIGKSPAYVTFYADAYREKIQSYQIKSVAAGSIFGCMTLTGGVAIILRLIYLRSGKGRISNNFLPSEGDCL